jgi:hypothetical protein
MDFEEFFKKKKIDLSALEKGEPALFYEFKTHYHEMGEKSFDHSKKFWFNKLRRRFHLAPEIKTERIQIENPIAEQTITQSLSASSESPKMGFVPKFKAGSIAKEPLPQESAPLPEEKPETKEPFKPAFQPRFKATPTTAQDPITSADQNNELDAKDKTTAQAENEQPRAAYQPRFKMKPKEEEKTETPPVGPQDEELPTTETEQPKPAYKPRFKMQVKPKQEE